jgi:hypothetical protein
MGLERRYNSEDGPRKRIGLQQTADVKTVGHELGKVSCNFQLMWKGIEITQANPVNFQN